jgi:hypothetical protein
VQRTQGAVGPHGHGDDLVDLDLPTLLELHGSLDGMGVVRVEVLLPGPVQTPRRRVDPLLDGGVRDLLHQDANLHFRASLSQTSVRDPTELTDESVDRGATAASGSYDCDTELRMKSTIAWVGAPGVKTSDTPSS